MRKYELTDETINYDGHVLHRIIALTSFNDIYIGELGGFIESENNLSNLGNCWVYCDAKVYGRAHIMEDAQIRDFAEVKDNAVIGGSASLLDYSKAYDYAYLFGSCTVFGHAEVYGHSRFQRASIGYNAKVSNINTILNISIRGDAVIESDKDYIVFKNWWSSGRFFIWTRSNNMWSVGCFYGTGEELIEKAYKDSELSGREYKRVVKYVESILKEEKK